MRAARFEVKLWQERYFSPDDPAWTCRARLEEKITIFVENKFGEDAVKSRATIRTYCTKALEKLQTPIAKN
jgi:hypothetical protein